MVSLPTFKIKCRCIYHTWTVWVCIHLPVFLVEVRKSQIVVFLSCFFQYTPRIVIDDLHVEFLYGSVIIIIASIVMGIHQTHIMMSRQSIDVILSPQQEDSVMHTQVLTPLSFLKPQGSSDFIWLISWRIFVPSADMKIWKILRSLRALNVDIFWISFGYLLPCGHLPHFSKSLKSNRVSMRQYAKVKCGRRQQKGAKSGDWICLFNASGKYLYSIWWFDIYRWEIRGKWEVSPNIH